KTMIAALPAGDDPDSLVRKVGGKVLQDQVHVARPAIEHFIERAFAAAGMGVEDKARAAMGLWPLFRALGQSLERDLYMARLAERVGIDTAQLQRHLEAAEREDRKTARSRGSTAEGRRPTTDHRQPT